MAYAKVRFIVDETGQERERPVYTKWKLRTEADIVRESLKIVGNWRGVSSPRVIAIMPDGSSKWQEVSGNGTA